MKIGDEVYIHGYVDEIRKGTYVDIVIIRNKGGYFGTDASEVIWADRKTESNCSEKPNNCDDVYPCDTCKHNKLEWFSEVCDGCCGAHSHFEPKTEPQTCSNCKFDHEEWFEEACDSCCDAHSNWQPKTEPQMWTCPKCGETHHIDFERCPCCGYEPKDEPQTMDTFAIDMAIAKCKARHNNCKNCNKTCMWRNEPQTEDAYAYDEDDWYNKAERESE